jgi:hypothetical protein
LSKALEIDEKVIENIIREVVEEKINSYDLKEYIQGKFKSISSDVVTKKIEEEVQRLLNEPIVTDDGWSHRESWDSFEAMFKAKFSERMNKTYEIQRVIQRTVEEKLDNLFKQKAKEVSAKIQDMVFEEMVKEEQK